METERTTGDVEVLPPGATTDASEPTTAIEVPPVTVLAPQEPTALEVVEKRKEWADMLLRIVTEKNLYTQIGDKRHLDAEAWQVVAAFDDAAPIPEWTRAVVEDGKVVAYEARVNLVKYMDDGTAQVVAAGEMVCGLTEKPTQSKQGWGKNRAAMSAAQTWAMAKAARIRYAWVPALAGFDPVPSHEADGNESNMAAPAARHRPSPSTVSSVVQPKDEPQAVDVETGEMIDYKDFPEGVPLTLPEFYQKVKSVYHVEPHEWATDVFGVKYVSDLVHIAETYDGGFPAMWNAVKNHLGEPTGEEA